MIRFDNTQVYGWEAAIRGMRNPMNSWDKSDSFFLDDSGDCYTVAGDIRPARIYISENGGVGDAFIGQNDHDLMMKLVGNGPVHAKYRRMIAVYVDITAPLYWWKEFDTYKVGTVANSCSTMHKIHAKGFSLDDFSCEHLRSAGKNILLKTIDALNAEREAFIGEGTSELKGDKQCWYSMIQLLPSSYNQKRTVMLNYEVLSHIYLDRRNHKLDEWHEFCDWIKNLPYSEIIVGGKED